MQLPSPSSHTSTLPFSNNQSIIYITINGLINSLFPLTGLAVRVVPRRPNHNRRKRRHKQQQTRCPLCHQRNAGVHRSHYSHDDLCLSELHPAGRSASDLALNGQGWRLWRTPVFCVAASSLSLTFLIEPRQWKRGRGQTPLC